MKIRLVKAAFRFAVHPLAIIYASVVWALGITTWKKSDTKLVIFASIMLFPVAFVATLIANIPIFLVGFVTQPLYGWHANSCTPSYVSNAHNFLEKRRHPERYQLANNNYIAIKTLLDKRDDYANKRYVKDETFSKLLHLLDLEYTPIKNFYTIKSKDLTIKTRWETNLAITFSDGVAFELRESDKKLPKSETYFSCTLDGITLQKGDKISYSLGNNAAKIGYFMSLVHVTTTHLSYSPQIVTMQYRLALVGEDNKLIQIPLSFGSKESITLAPADTITAANIRLRRQAHQQSLEKHGFFALPDAALTFEPHLVKMIDNFLPDVLSLP